MLTTAHCGSKTDKGYYGCATFVSLEPRDCYVTADHALALYMPWSKRATGDFEVKLANGQSRSVSAVRVYPGYSQVYQTDKPGWKPYGCYFDCAKVDHLALVSGDLALLRAQREGHRAGSLHDLASTSNVLTDGQQVQGFGWGDTDPGSADKLPGQSSPQQGGGPSS